MFGCQAIATPSTKQIVSRTNGSIMSCTEILFYRKSYLRAAMFSLLVSHNIKVQLYEENHNTFGKFKFLILFCSK